MSYANICVLRERIDSYASRSIAIALLFFLSACTVPVHLELEECWAEDFSDSDDRMSDLKLESAEYAVVLFSADIDIVELSTRIGSYDVSYRLVPCGSDPIQSSLCGGDVTAIKQGHVLGHAVHFDKSPNWYVVFLPLEPSWIVDCAMSLGGDELGEKIYQAQENGICMEVSEASMLGHGFHSNQIRLPLVLSDETLRLQSGSAL